MRGISIGEQARSGEWCDICKKMIYLNTWAISGHIEMHRRELQRQEDARAARAASERFMERLREACNA